MAAIIKGQSGQAIEFEKPPLLPSGSMGVFNSYNTTAVNTTPDIPDGQGISVLEVTSATATITLPAGSSVPTGGRVLIRKKNSTMGAVNINEDGTDSVQWGSAQLRLYSDGDYWLLMWDGGRWNLLEGYETGSNADGEWEKSATGVMIIQEQFTDINQNVSNTFGSFRSNDVNWSFPQDFTGAPAFYASVNSSRSWCTGDTAVGNAVFRIYSDTTNTDRIVRAVLIGRWYSL